MSGSAKPSGVEDTKARSRHLRGEIAADLAGPSAHVSDDTYNLLKFHGTYEQFDRDTATERKQRGEDKDWQFMVRVRAPGGRLTADQYLALDALADQVGDHTLRLTTRQGVQFHGIVKTDLKSTIAEINHALMTTMSACGDVVRNVVTTPAPRRDAVHARLEADARMLSNALLPRSRAYHQIFLNEGETGADETEELYGSTYLPRKFKIGIAHPGDNSIDVLANDLGFVAVFEGDTLRGYNVAVGGGMGMTHGKTTTFPRFGSVIGSVAPDGLLEAARAVIALQRDNGNRSDRKRARLKYVVHDKGEDWVRDTLAAEYGLTLAPALNHPPFSIPELLGWHDQGDGRAWLGLPIAAGRIADRERFTLRTGLREVISRWRPSLVATPQQDLLIADLDPADRTEIEAVLRAHGFRLAEDLTPLDRFAIACVALPTCGQSLAEGERVRAPMVAAVENALRRHGLEQERISFRLSGCANGCARPYGGDIGVVGRLAGHYSLFVGGDFTGTRLSFKLRDRVPEAQVAATLEPLFAAWAQGRRPGEGFGDWATRLGHDALDAVLAAAPVEAIHAA